MRASTIVMIGFAVVFGLLAVFIAQIWLNNQANQRMRSLEASNKPVATQTIVVAKQPLRFGTELSAAMLEEVAVAGEGDAGRRLRQDRRRAVNGGRRVVLTAIEPNEPVLALQDHRAGSARHAVGAGARRA